MITAADVIWAVFSRVEYLKNIKGGGKMAGGGFLVQFDGKESVRCYSVSFDYDRGTYTINNNDSKDLPKGVKSITVTVERSSDSR